MVELIPSTGKDKALVQNLFAFYKSIGKATIVEKSSYGYAIVQIFEGLCQIAMMCLEKGLENKKQIDKVACDTLGLGVGSFNALNLTGGNPITAHGLDKMHEKLMAWLKTPALLNEAVKYKTNWNIDMKDEVVEVPAELNDRLRDELLGGNFSLASFIIDLGITNIKDLDLSCKKSLSVKVPFTFMNEFGVTKAFEAVKKFNARHPTFKIPFSLEAAAKKWNLGD